MMTAPAAARNLNLVTGSPSKFCTECGRELPEAGGLCPACPQVDARRRAVIASYRGQLEALRDVDAAEHAAELRLRADAARAAHDAVLAEEERLDAAARGALAAERKAADVARASAEHHQKTVTAHRRAQRAQRPGASAEARTEALWRMRAAADVAEGDKAAAEGAVTARKNADAALKTHREQVLPRLEDAAVGAERAAANPPARVPPSLMTCLLAHPMFVLLLADLDDTARAFVSLQAGNWAKLSGLAEQLRAEGRAEKQKEIEAARGRPMPVFGRDGEVTAAHLVSVPRGRPGG